MSDDEGFLSRWSRRKAQLRSGDAPPDKALRDKAPTNKALPDKAPPDKTPRSEPLDSLRPTMEANAPRVDTPHAPATPIGQSVATTPDMQPPGAAQVTLPPPTLADVARLTPTSDFSRYVGPGVDGSVQHAALKTLFSDPHFNVMDGLDTYIGDYNTPNPIPDAMMRRLVEAGAMRLFDPSTSAAEAASAAPASAATSPLVASPGNNAPALPSSGEVPDSGAFELEPEREAEAAEAKAEPESETEPGIDIDEDTALRLQPDDAADAAGAGSHRRRARP